MKTTMTKKKISNSQPSSLNVKIKNKQTQDILGCYMLITDIQQLLTDNIRQYHLYLQYCPKISTP